MFRNLLIASIFFLTLSCGQRKGDYYFDFDEVDHYSISIDEDVLFDLEERNDLSTNERLKIDVILNDTPEKFQDTSFISKLTKIGFTKHKVAENKHPELSEIFRDKSHKEVYALACIYVYRDVLIFKKSDSIVGVAKVCFDCLNSQILGTSVNTSEFGQSGDYGKLHRLLTE